MIGHAGDSNDLDYLTELADAGVLLGMDRFGLDIFNPGAEWIKTIAVLAARGYAASMVLAHDANCFIDYFGAAHDMARAAAAPNWHYEHISGDQPREFPVQRRDLAAARCPEPWSASACAP